MVQLRMSSLLDRCVLRVERWMVVEAKSTSNMIMPSLDHKAQGSTRSIHDPDWEIQVCLAAEHSEQSSSYNTSERQILPETHIERDSATAPSDDLKSQ
jgi:hypothetical protein